MPTKTAKTPSYISNSGSNSECHNRPMTWRMKYICKFVCMVGGMKKTKDISAKLHAYANNVRLNIWQSLHQCMLIWGFEVDNTRTLKPRKNECRRGNKRQLHSCSCNCSKGKQTNNEEAFEYVIAIQCSVETVVRWKYTDFKEKLTQHAMAHAPVPLHGRTVCGCSIWNMPTAAQSRIMHIFEIKMGESEIHRRTDI